MSVQHTPAPWSLDGRSVMGRAFDGSLCAICERVRGGSPQAADANAHLIAAAPDLLRELKAMRSRFRNSLAFTGTTEPFIDEATREADDVIAKAEGRT